MFTQAKSLLKSRIVVALLAVAMVFIFLVSSSVPKTSAVDHCSWDSRVTFYTDATRTTSCGVTVISCDGQIVHSGCWTSYRTLELCNCEE